MEASAKYTLRGITLQAYDDHQLEKCLALSNAVFNTSKEENSSRFASKDVWLDYLASGNGSIYYTADANSNPVSFMFIRDILFDTAILVGIKQQKVTKARHIWLCGTDPEHRSTGLLQALFRKALDDVRQMTQLSGEQPMYISVRTMESVYTDMVSWIQKQGFERISSQTKDGKVLYIRPLSLDTE